MTQQCVYTYVYVYTCMPRSRCALNARGRAHRGALEELPPPVAERWLARGGPYHQPRPVDAIGCVCDPGRRRPPLTDDTRLEVNLRRRNHAEKPPVRDSFSRAPRTEVSGAAGPGLSSASSAFVPADKRDFGGDSTSPGHIQDPLSPVVCIRSVSVRCAW